MVYFPLGDHLRDLYRGNMHDFLATPATDPEERALEERMLEDFIIYEPQVIPMPGYLMQEAIGHMGSNGYRIVGTQYRSKIMENFQGERIKLTVRSNHRCLSATVTRLTESQSVQRSSLDEQTRVS